MNYFINNLTKNDYYRLTANDSVIDDYIDNSESNYYPGKKIVLLLAFFLSFSYAENNVNTTLEQAIGHLIKYQTDRKINMKHGTNSPFSEVVKTYYKLIEPLPEDDRAMFFYMVDNHLNVHGGSGLFDFYNFIYLCCESEYISLLENNLDNPYFDSEVLKRKLLVMTNSEKRIRKGAKWRKKTIDDYKVELKKSFLEMIQK